MLRADAEEAGFDGVIAWSMGGSTLDRFANVFYLTNHYQPCCVLPDGVPLWTGFGHAAVVLPVDGEAVLVVDQPDWRTDFVECDRVIVRRDVYAGVVEAARDAGLLGKRIGLLDEERMTVAALRAVSAGLPSTTLERADELAMRRRMVKSPAEIDMMRQSSRISGELMSAMFAEVAEGRTDGDVVAAGYALACRLGAQPYDFAMASGPEDGHLWWPRLPSWNWQRPYEKGDIVHPDIYGVVDGYFYDFVRSIVVGGEPTPEQDEILEGGIGCIHAACDAARAGNLASDVYRAGRAYLREHGLDHEEEAGDEVSLSTDVLESIGHGIGLGWELPWLTPTSDVVLEPGMTIAVEQHVSRPGVGTMRYEETVLVTDGEPEIMTASCPARWW
ncbi:MAG TPA: Xaa-Pro peptidase family protein [Solirubrobacteraceae bacterium]|nr:Xaa-Pro peptidase family protein [Solirubrobacteraceae bacterium]